MTRKRNPEAGFTLIELLIAAMITAIGILALVSTFDTSRTLVSVAERNEAMAHQGQREVERILAMDYEDIALTGAPQPSPNPNHPGFFVQGGQYQWDQGDTGPRSDDLVIDPAGSVPPMATWEAETRPSGGVRMSGEIHRYVTQVYDPELVQTPNDEPDAKRVTVAVTVDGPGGPTKPLLISSIVVDPNPE